MTTATLFVDLPIESEYFAYVKLNPEGDENVSDKEYPKAFKKWSKGFSALAFEHACFWVKKYMGENWSVTSANFEDENLRMDIKLRKTV